MTDHRAKLVERRLPVGELNVDVAYQRLIVKSQVKTITDNYNEAAFGRLLVGQRQDSTKWVVDGQQRLEAARKLEFKYVPCLMFDSQGRQHEARLFVMYNKDRAGVKPIDVFKAALEAREPEAVLINSLIQEEGFEINKKGASGGPTMLAGVNTLYTILRRGGPDHMRTVLRVLKDAWPADPQRVNGYLLEGVSQFTHRAHGRYDPRRLPRKLSTVSPTDMLNYVRDLSRFGTGGSSRGLIMAAAVQSIYNKGLRSGRIDLNFAKEGVDLHPEAPAKPELPGVDEQG